MRIVCKKRHGLGRDGVLGDFYDASSDQFTGENIFKHPLPPSMLYAEDVPDGVNMKYVFSDTLAEKFEKLQINTSLRLSLLCGYNPYLNGSGQYLIDSGNGSQSKKCIRRSLVYSVPTKVQQFLLSYSDLITIINYDAIKRTRATHVVAKIKWGANAILTLQAEAESMGKFQKTKQDLEALLVSMGSEISTRSQFESINAVENNRIDFSLASDVRPNEYPLETVEDAFNFMSDLPDILKNVPNGLGKPLIFYLVSVHEIMKILKLIDSRRSLISRRLSHNSTLYWVRYFDRLNQIKKSYFDLEETLKSKRTDLYFCDYSYHVKHVSHVRKMFIHCERSFRRRFAKAVLKARKGNSDDLNNLKIRVSRGIIERFNGGAPVMSELVNVFSGMLYHKKFLAAMQKKLELMEPCEDVRKPDIYGANTNADYNFYVGDIHVPEMRNGTVLEAFVLLYHSNFRLFEFDIWEHLAFFVNLKEIKKRAKMWIVDLEQFPQFSFQKTRIVHIVVREMEVFVHSEDYFRDTANNGLNLIYTERFDYVWKKPIKRAALKVFCPRAIHVQFKKCEREEVNWQCVKCREEIEYGFDSYFYCRCGKVFYRNCRFRCANRNHAAFIKFDETVLSNFLKRNYV